MLHSRTNKLRGLPHDLKQRLNQVRLHLHDRRSAADSPDAIKGSKAQFLVVAPVMGKFEEAWEQNLYLRFQRREQHYQCVERADDSLLLDVLLLVR